MRFKQTQEILNHTRSFHSSLSGCYQHLADEAVRERTKLLIDYMVQREHELADAIQDFIRDTEPDILDTWFQFSDESKLLEFSCAVIDENADFSVDDIVRLAQEAHECLISTFEEIIVNCESPRVCDVFRKLAIQATNQWHALVRDTVLLSDL